MVNISVLQAVVACDPARGFVDQYRLLRDVNIGHGQVQRTRYRWRTGALVRASVDSNFDPTPLTRCGTFSSESADVVSRLARSVESDLSGPDPVPPLSPDAAVGGDPSIASVSGPCWLLRNRTVRCQGGVEIRADRSDLYGSLDEYSGTPELGGVVAGVGSVVDLDFGGRRACAVLADGSVRCWGSNVNGLLGDGTRRRRNFSVRAFDFSSASRVYVGPNSTCVVDGDPRPSCWGTYDNRLTYGPVAPLVGPIRIDGVSEVQSIWMGYRVFVEDLEENCALLRSAEVWCWNSVGSAVSIEGMGLVPTEVRPVREPALDGTTQLATGVGELCAVTTQGVIRCPRAGLESPPGFAEVAVWGSTICGRKLVGALTCWEVARPTPGEVVVGPPLSIPILDALSLGDGPCAVTRTDVRCWTITKGVVSPIESFTTAKLRPTKR